MFSLEELLKPVSTDAPAGHSLRNADGDPVKDLEVSIESNDPNRDWDAVNGQAIELLKRSKDLKVAIILCLGVLKENGLPGFKDGLLLVHGLLDKFWAELFPAMPSGNPLRRINILNLLSVEFTSPTPTSYKFITFLRETPLYNSRQSGPVSLNDLRSPPVPAAAAPAGDKKNGNESNQAARLLEDADPAGVEQSLGQIKAIETTLDLIVKLVESKLSDPGPNQPAGELQFKKLTETLSAMREHLTGEKEPDKKEEIDVVTLKEKTLKPGKIDSPKAVVAALEEVRRYYQRYEPSSPVPLLLERAQRLAEMNFWDIIQDLTPEALEPLRKITGEVKAKITETKK